VTKDGREQARVPSPVDLAGGIQQALQAAAIALHKTHRLVKRKRKIRSRLVVDCEIFDHRQCRIWFMNGAQATPAGVGSPPAGWSIQRLNAD
jgi:hypothetical protein